MVVDQTLPLAHHPNPWSVHPLDKLLFKLESPVWDWPPTSGKLLDKGYKSPSPPSSSTSSGLGRMAPIVTSSWGRDTQQERLWTGVCGAIHVNLQLFAVSLFCPMNFAKPRTTKNMKPF
eukprot:779183-Amphidinium_carterae.1